MPARARRPTASATPAGRPWGNTNMIKHDNNVTTTTTTTNNNNNSWSYQKATPCTLNVSGAGFSPPICKSGFWEQPRLIRPRL